LSIPCDLAELLAQPTRVLVLARITAREYGGIESDHARSRSRSRGGIESDHGLACLGNPQRPLKVLKGSSVVLVRAVAIECHQPQMQERPCLDRMALDSEGLESRIDHDGAQECLSGATGLGSR
jgi:hypothetical protein